MAAPPPLTVVTTTYNWPEALAQAIPTALNQTFGDFEYLIVGDGCADETEDLVRSFDDPRIVWRNLPENTGNQSGASKAALEIARGAYIAYLNHDDLWFPDHVESLITPIRAHGFDIINSLCLEISPPGHPQRLFLGLPRQFGEDRIGVAPMTSTVMHSAQAGRAAGGWIDWRQTTEVPTYDFFRRVRLLNGNFGVVAHLTSLKFHSADRPNSYVSRDASEQRGWAARMAAEPHLRYWESMAATACHAVGKPRPVLAQPDKPADAPPGWQIEQWRRMRGLAPMLDLGDAEPGEAPALPPSEPDYIRIDEAGRPIIARAFASGR